MDTRDKIAGVGAHSKRARGLGGALLGMLLLTMLLNANAAFAAERNFSLRYDVLQQGANLAQIGNLLMTCDSPSLQDSSISCASTQNGLPQNQTWFNDRYNMKFVDVDSDSSTWDSSTSTLSIPSGVTVLRAQLYWGGSVNGNDKWDTSVPTSVMNPSPGTYGNVAQTMKFKGPGDASYSNVTATQLDFEDTSSNNRTGRPYGATADITSLFTSHSGWTSAGGGTFTGANVIATRGCTSGNDNFNGVTSCATYGDSKGDGNMGNYAGWSLLLVYDDPTDTTIRYIGINDGFQCVLTSGTGCQGNGSVTLSFTGFNVPPNTSGSRWGALAWDGDQGTGDQFFVNDLVTPQSDNSHPISNYFQSRISVNGTNVSTRNPNFVSTMGEDIIESNSVQFAGGTTTVPGKFTTGGELVVLHYFWLVVETTATDYGDAPTSYGVASHDISTSATTLRLGTKTTDPEAGMQNTGADATTALGDDTHGTDDEDGVAWTISNATVNYQINVHAQNTLSSPSGSANVCGWLDTNNNGVFDSSEGRCTTVAASTTTDLVLTWNGVGPKANGTTFYARFRITKDSLTTSNPTGSAANGEVEDYKITVQNPTASTLSSFDAKARSKTIHLAWSTGNETDVVGFSVWRKDGKSGWSKRNTSPITGHPGSPLGYNYGFNDKQVKTNIKYQYKIEILKIRDAPEWSDVVTVRAK